MTAFEDTFDTTRDTLVFYFNEYRNTLLIGIADEYTEREAAVNDFIFQIFRDDRLYQSVRDATFDRLNESCEKGVI